MADWRWILLAAAVLASGAAAPPKKPAPPPGPPWVLQNNTPTASIFLRATGAVDAAGYRTVERLFLQASLGPKSERRVEARREANLVSCDWLSVNDGVRIQRVDLDGRDLGAPTAGKDDGDRFLFLDRHHEALTLKLACGFGDADGEVFATTAAALAYATKRLPAQLSPPVPSLMIPPSPPTGGREAWPGGDYYLAAKGRQGQALFLDHGQMSRDGDLVKIRTLVVLPDKDGGGLRNMLRDVLYDCARGEETVTRAWVFNDQYTMPIYAELTRPVKGLPATAAGLALACGGDDWNGHARKIEGGVAGAVTFAQGGGG